MLIIINPVWHCNLTNYLLTDWVNAYPCNRLLTLGYFLTTWNCCATSVFSNRNPKTNGTLNKLRLLHLHSSFRLLSATQWLEDTQRQIPHDNASTVKEQISLFSEDGSRFFTQNASDLLLMITPASIIPERAFSSADISKLRSRMIDAVLDNVLFLHTYFAPKTNRSVVNAI